MKTMLLFLTAAVCMHAGAIVRTYWSYTNEWNNLPDLEAGKIRFSDGSAFDTNYGLGQPVYYDSYEAPATATHTNHSYVGRHILFANGRPIAITGIPSTAAKVRVSWARYLPTSTFHFIDVPNDTIVFAGGDGDRGVDANHLTTSVTVRDATIGAIYGGNMGYGTVGNVTISVAGDSNVRLIYGSNYGHGNYEQSVPDRKVNRACAGNVTIDVDCNEGYGVRWIYGGGFSVSDVGTCNINIRGGHVEELIPGPASGLAGSLTTTVSGGVVDRLAAWSRGYVGSSTIRVTGGIVDYLAAGGDQRTVVGGSLNSGSGSGPGSVESAYGGKVELELVGGVVSNLWAGLNGGVVDTSMVSGVYSEGSVLKYNGASFDPAPLHLEYAVSHAFNNAIRFRDAGNGNVYRVVCTNGVLQTFLVSP